MIISVFIRLAQISTSVKKLLRDILQRLSLQFKLLQNKLLLNKQLIWQNIRALWPIQFRNQFFSWKMHKIWPIWRKDKKMELLIWHHSKRLEKRKLQQSKLQSMKLLQKQLLKTLWPQNKPLLIRLKPKKQQQKKLQSKQHWQKNKSLLN